MLNIVTAVSATGTATATQTGGVQVGCIITGTLTTPGVCVLSSVPYMMIGILLSLFIIALTYMIGNVMNYSKMKDWYKAELWETIKSMLLVVIIIAALVILSATANALAGNQATQPNGPLDQGALNANLAGLYMTANSMYLYPQLQNSYTAFDALQGMSFGNAALQTLRLDYFLPIPLFIPWPPFPIIGALKDGANANIFSSNYLTFTVSGSTFSITNDLTTIIVVPLMMIFQVQYNMFFYIVALGLGVLIPVGIILRAIPVLRGLGGSAIALGIGMAIIYPGILVLFNLPLSNYIYTFTLAQSQLPGSGCPFTTTLVCQIWDGFTSSLISSIPGTSIASTAFSLYNPIVLLDFGQFGASSAAISAWNTGFNLGLISPLASGSIYPSLNFIIDNMIGSILQFILIALDIMIGLILANSVASMLGGQLTLGLWHMKLV
jgi:hypothetical protein